MCVSVQWREWARDSAGERAHRYRLAGRYYIKRLFVSLLRHWADLTARIVDQRQAFQSAWCAASSAWRADACVREAWCSPCRRDRRTRRVLSAWRALKRATHRKVSSFQRRQQWRWLGRCFVSASIITAGRGFSPPRRSIDTLACRWPGPSIATRWRASELTRSCSWRSYKKSRTRWTLAVRDAKRL
jgi:hypothetical protein